MKYFWQQLFIYVFLLFIIIACIGAIGMSINAIINDNFTDFIFYCIIAGIDIILTIIWIKELD